LCWFYGFLSLWGAMEIEEKKCLSKVMLNGTDELVLFDNVFFWVFDLFVSVQLKVLSF
jgi:hypothetical protein